MAYFRKLRVWEASLDLTKKIYSITAGSSFNKDYSLKDQIRRAAVSVTSNIAEGAEQLSEKKSIYHFSIAKGSTAEIITQLHIAFGISYIDKDTFDRLENDSEKIRASLNKLIKAFQNN